MVNAFKVFSRYFHNTILLIIFILPRHRPLEHIASLTLTRYPTSPNPSLINLFLNGFSFHWLRVYLPPQRWAIYLCSFHSSNSHIPMATGMSSEWTESSSAQICMFWAPGRTRSPQPPKRWMVHASVVSKTWDLLQSQRIGLWERASVVFKKHYTGNAVKVLLKKVSCW